MSRNKKITTLKQQLAIGIQAIGATRLRATSGGENVYVYKSAKGELVELSTGVLIDIGRWLSDGYTLKDGNHMVWIKGAGVRLRDHLP